MLKGKEGERYPCTGACHRIERTFPSRLSQVLRIVAPPGSNKVKVAVRNPLVALSFSKRIG